MAWGSAPVAHTLAQSTNTNTIVSSAINTSGADTLFAQISWYIGGGGGAVLTDSKSNTWTALTLGNGGAQLRSQMYYCKNCITDPSHTFTVTGTGSYPAVAVSAWAGGDTSAPFDKQIINPTAGGTPSSLQPGSITPTNANELIISGISAQDTLGAVPTINSGFTVTDAANRISNGLAVGMAYLVQGAASAVNPTWSFTSSSSSGVDCSQQAFIAASGGGGTTVALTGVSGTGAVGTLAPSASLAITGNTGTGTVGSLAPSVSIALTGVSATGDVGTLTPVSGVFVALTGVSATGDVGLLAPSVSAVLTGVQATGDVGSLSIPGSNVFGRSGLGGDDVPRRKNPNRGWDREEWLARKQKMDDMEDTLRATYQTIKRTALPSVIKEVEKVVAKNVIKVKNDKGILERSIDFRALASNYERTNSLLQLLDDDDEEEIILIAAQQFAFRVLQ